MHYISKYIIYKDLDKVLEITTLNEEFFSIVHIQNVIGRDMHQ